MTRIIEPREIDSELLEATRFERGSVDVYKVKRNGAFYILKVAPVSHDWEAKHLASECKALRLAREVDGITHLVREYFPGDHVAFLKEYADGPDLAELKTKPKGAMSDIIVAGLEATIKQLHQAGVGKLDLREENIVISPGLKSAKIIDLGGCVFSEDLMDDSLFEKVKEYDLSALDNFVAFW